MCKRGNACELLIAQQFLQRHFNIAADIRRYAEPRVDGRDAFDVGDSLRDLHGFVVTAELFVRQSLIDERSLVVGGHIKESECGYTQVRRGLLISSALIAGNATLQSI